MRVKGAVLALYTLGVGCLLLFAESGVGTAFGVALITLVSTAVVAKYGTRQSDRGRAGGGGGRRDPE